MKKLIAIFSVISILLVMFPTTAFAADRVSTDREIEYFEDGSYIVTEFEENSISTLAASTVTKTKSSNYYSSSGDIEWTVKLTATFSYTGSSATCTSAATSHTIYNSNWKVTSAAASKSGNKATGNFTVKRYNFGILTKTIEKTLTITCSNTGVCS